jgi:transcription initiation factor TFIIIB Brf1 subunit/transcription initiation factor TFIIB
MFGLYEKYLESKDVSTPVTPQCDEHLYFTNNDGTFCMRCSMQLIDPMPVQDHIQEKSVVGIRKDIESLSLSPEVVDLTNAFFIKTCKNRIHRGKHRKAIICACLFHVYILKQIPQNFDTLINLFGINNRYANTGFNLVKLNVPELQYLKESPSDIASVILKVVGIEDNLQCLEFIQRPDILRFVEEKITRRMYTNVAAFVYIYLKKKYTNLVLSDYCDKLKLSPEVVERIINTIKAEIHL